MISAQPPKTESRSVISSSSHEMLARINMTTQTCAIIATTKITSSARHRRAQTKIHPATVETVIPAANPKTTNCPLTNPGIGLTKHEKMSLSLPRSQHGPAKFWANHKPSGR